jgi:hypothetical protein
MINDLMDRYLKIEASGKINHEKISKKLGVCFSNDFKNISKKARFDYLNVFDWLSLDQEKEHSVIGDTISLRKTANLPKDTLFLSEDDASALLMKCFGTHEEIYWIAIEDFERFCNDEKLEYDYTFFPTFTAFFEYLLDEGEKERAGKGCD